MRRLPAILIVPFAMLAIAAGPAGTASSASCSAGTIRVWGDKADRAMIEALEQAYRIRAPYTCFANALHGPESAIAGVYTGVADLAFMAREVREPMERMAFEWARLDKPTVISFAHGGLLADRQGAQLAVIVHPSNPVQRLTLAELDAIMGAEGLRGARPIRHWGEAGAKGEWATRPLNLYGSAIDGPPMLFIRRLVMKDSRKWNPGYRALADDRAIVDAVRGDRGAVAIVAAGAVKGRAKIVAVSEKAGAPAVLPQADAIVAGTYPLARKLGVVVDRSQGETLPLALAGFLAFMLGAEGQAVIARSGTHLPLSPVDAAAELEKVG